MPDSVKDWNQFEANERLFGIKPEFNEADYTTVLDKNSEFYLKNVARAKKIEHDILTSKCGDRHRMEERGLIECENEEDRYSAVLYKKKGRKSGKKGEKETERSWSEGEKKVISQVEGRKATTLGNDTKSVSHGGEKKVCHADVTAQANDTKSVSHGVEKKGVPHVDAKKADKVNENAVQDGSHTDRKVPHDTHKKHAVDSENAQADKPCEGTSNDKLSKPKEDTKGPVSLKGVSYKKNVSSTFKTIKEYIESITSKFTGSLVAAGRWGNGDSYKIINDDKPVKNLFGRKR
ncbi:Protein interacting with poly(A)-binding protein [Trachipleistophora hominis]|uniref:Protein interacting with poly(A)-binding protein n=1 Tax=Trachipleistophora hominis TaxID=72359 RepID=L7JZS3_TRAHO|nr:Protein interacting with poly(A)-binding protein [Trachipleistophora hominis]